jgi:Chitobiase/beta-hexosaminidase C-terminal domain/PA14 domain
LDVSNHTLHLAPVLRAAESRVSLPIYFPRFWATVTADKQRHTLVFKVSKVFGASDIVLTKVIAQPVGQPSSAQRVVQIPAFTVREGATLDLSSYWDALVGGRYEPGILPHADKVPFLRASPKLVLAPVAVPSQTQFIASVSVSLKTDTPGSTVFYTTDGTDPQLHGHPYNQPILLTANTTLRAAARSGKDWSPVCNRGYVREPDRIGDLPAGSKTGNWTWRYYEGPFERLPDFSKLTPLASGETDKPNLDMRRREDHFAVVFKSVLEVRKRGLYTFHLNSDDGSRLTIGGRDVLDHDGIHDLREIKSLALPLQPGHYSLKLEYFQGAGGYGLHLDWDSPNRDR